MTISQVKWHFCVQTIGQVWPCQQQHASNVNLISLKCQKLLNCRKISSILSLIHQAFDSSPATRSTINYSESCKSLIRSFCFLWSFLCIIQSVLRWNWNSKKEEEAMMWFERSFRRCRSAKSQSLCNFSNVCNLIKTFLKFKTPAMNNFRALNKAPAAQETFYLSKSQFCF